MAIFLGIDGGSTKTTCVVGDEQTVFATAITAGSNVVRRGEDAAREAIQQAVREACTAAKVDPAQISRVCAGLSGGARPEISAIVHRILAEVVSCPIEVVGDMVTTMEAAFGSGPGIIVIAGTGSIAYGRTANGQTARAGGWGFQISDEGSGQWIGRSAVASVVRAQDELDAAPTTLTAGVLEAWQLRTLEELVRAANATPPPDFSTLFGLVLKASDAGDALARTVLTQAGTELARLAKIVIARIFPDDPVVPVAMSGGVFQSSALVRQVFYNSLRAEYPNAKIASIVVDPVNGALALARKSGA